MSERLWKSLILVISLGIFLAASWEHRSLEAYLYLGLTLSALSTFVNIFALRQRTPGRTNYLPLILPGFFLLGLFGVIPGISDRWFTWLIALISSVLFYIYERGYPQKTARWFEETFSLTAGFLVLTALWSWNYFFTPPWAILVLLTTVLFFFFFLQSLDKQYGSGKNLFLLTLVSTLLVMEIVWVVLFLPVHFFTATVVSFSAFYLIFILGGYHFSGHLTRRRVIFQCTVISLVLFFSLLSSPWTIR